MNHRHRIISAFVLAATLACSFTTVAAPASCPQALACQQAQAMFLEQDSTKMIHRAQDLPADMMAALVASTGSRLIANRPAIDFGLVPTSVNEQSKRYDEHQFSMVSRNLAAIVYRARGTRAGGVLLLFAREPNSPVCRFHLNDPVASIESIRQTLTHDFSRATTVYSGCHDK